MLCLSVYFRTNVRSTLGKLKLKRYDKIELPTSVIDLQKVIDSRLPLIRIEELLIGVLRETPPKVPVGLTPSIMSATFTSSILTEYAG